MNESVLGAVLVVVVLFVIAGRRFMRWWIGTDALEARLVEIRDLLAQHAATPATPAVADVPAPPVTPDVSAPPAIRQPARPLFRDAPETP